ncbi:MAG: NAD(P)-dependent oxidoreductase [Acutalibacteraceae bacterium]
MKIGFIGIGIMGEPMAENLIKAGYSLNVFSRKKEKAEKLISLGAEYYSNIGECVSGCDAVITIVGYPEDVEEVYLGKGNILDSAKKGAYLIDMTTSSPTLAQKINNESKNIGLHSLDAPVTGGEIGAINGTLSVLVGGNKQDFDACKPIFSAMCKRAVYFGKAGSGQHAKLANQIMIGANVAGVCEAFIYAKNHGIDISEFFNAVENGAASSFQLSTAGKRLVENDFSPTFFTKHIIKDLKLAKNESEGLKLDVLNQVLNEYLSFNGNCDNLGTQSLIKYYEE